MSVNTSTDKNMTLPCTESYEMAFLGSLLPGIIHNMATPLSGVLGATQLLENRSSSINELLHSKTFNSEASRRELIAQLERNRTNVEILGRNANHLAELLQIIVQRINRGGLQMRDTYSLNELLQNELRFLEANLQFKHRVRKSVTLAADVPAAHFVYGHVSAVLDEFVGYAISLHDLTQGALDISFETSWDENFIILMLTSKFQQSPNAPDEPSLLELYLARLQEDGWKSDLKLKQNCLSLSLMCPRRRNG